MERHIKLDRQLDLYESVKATAGIIGGILKTVPRTGKRNRNIFIKTYNRRPQNKNRKRLAYINLALSALFGAMNIQRIISTPIPRYKHGS